MTASLSSSAVRCGNRKVHGTTRATHETIAQIKLCFSRPQGVESIEEAWRAAEAKAEIDAEMGYERHLENAGYDEARFQEDMEARMGVIPFEDAMAIAAAAVEVSAFQARLAALTGPSELIPAVVPETPWKSEPEPVILDGIYTIESAEGHRTLRLRTQDADDEFAPGEQVIAFLSGPDNEHDYTGFGFIKGGQLKRWKRFATNAALLRDAEALLADPSGALKAAHCARCHRKLTRPSSINAMIGPECSRKL